MIPHIGFAEMLLIAVIVIIFVGPKDLPRLMRTVSEFMTKARAMGQEFKGAFDEMSSELEMADIRGEIDALKHLDNFPEMTDTSLREEMQAIDQDIDAHNSDITDHE